MLKICAFIFNVMFFSGFAFAQQIEILQQNQPCSIRGLSILNNKIAWVSGSKGHVAKTTDGGKTWSWQQIKGFEQSDFRDVEVLSAKTAIIMSSGSPALILKTIDGGLNWKVVYRNDNPAYFLDAMDFMNAKNGYVLGDPIDQKFLILATKDSGNSWKTLPALPKALPGEAAFAASGTCISVDKKTLKFVTGGIYSQQISKRFPDSDWKYVKLPLSQGKASAGAFSIKGDKNSMLIVGGDYQQINKTDSVMCYDSNGFLLAQTAPAGFQSCVELVDKQVFISTGTSGTNLTEDGGKTWRKIDNISYNVCQKAKHGNLILLVGDQGKIALFKNH